MENCVCKVHKQRQRRALETAANGVGGGVGVGGLSVA